MKWSWRRSNPKDGRALDFRFRYHQSSCVHLIRLMDLWNSQKRRRNALIPLKLLESRHSNCNSTNHLLHIPTTQLKYGSRVKLTSGVATSVLKGLLFKTILVSSPPIHSVYPLSKRVTITPFELSSRESTSREHSFPLCKAFMSELMREGGKLREQANSLVSSSV